MKIQILYLLVVSLFFINPPLGESQKNHATYSKTTVNLHPQNWKNSELITLLRNGKIVSIQPMREHLKSCGKKKRFSGENYVVELDIGIKAVFKRFPQEHLNIMDAYGEVVAYQASVVLGFPYIPPTIMATIGNKKGSLQLFVDTDIDPLAPGTYKTALKEASPDDVSNIKLFWFIFGQWDTGPHNTLILKKNNKTYLIAIDNSGICKRQHVIYGQLPFLELQCSPALQTDDWDKPFPFDQVQVIKSSTIERIRNVFGKKLPESFYTNIKLGTPFYYVLYRNCIWKQRRVEIEDLFKSFTNHLPDETRKTLESLNLAVLKKIFSCAKDSDFLSPSYLQDILARRDQVLAYFNKKDVHKRRQ